MYFEHSKADDVKFILDLIEKIGKEIPEADMSNVNIAGKQNQGVYKNEVKLQIKTLLLTILYLEMFYLNTIEQLFLSAEQ